MVHKYFIFCSLSYWNSLFSFRSSISWWRYVPQGNQFYKSTTKPYCCISVWSLKYPWDHPCQCQYWRCRWADLSPDFTCYLQKEKAPSYSHKYQLDLGMCVKFGVGIYMFVFRWRPEDNLRQKGLKPYLYFWPDVVPLIQTKNEENYATVVGYSAFLHCEYFASPKATVIW